MKSEPKNEKIYTRLKELILSGHYSIGEKLPPEQEFARSLDVAKVTLRSALSRLEEEGLISRRRSVGTVVVRNAPAAGPCILIVTDHMDESANPNAHLLALLQKQAQERNIRFEQLERFYIEGMSREELRQVCQAARIDAVIFMASYFTGKEPVIEKLKSLQKPVILPHAFVGDAELTGFAAVCIKEREGWFQAMSYVAGRRPRKLAILSLRDEYGLDNIRTVGFSEIRSYFSRIIPDGNLCFQPVTMNYSDIERAIEVLLADGQPPDTLMCYSDFIAILAVKVLNKRGLNVPDDISVMGFSGLPFQYPVSWQLTTVDYRYEEAVRLALDLAFEAESWFDPAFRRGGPCRYITPVLREGDTVAPERMPELAMV